LKSFVLVLLGLLCALSLAADARRPNVMECELDIVQITANHATKQSITETQAHHIWIKGNLVRREERSVGGTEILVEGSGKAYLYSPEAKRGLKRASDKPVARGEYPEFFDAEGFRDWVKKSGAKKTGSDKVNGVDCEVYALTDGPATIKRWLRDDNGQLVKNTLAVEQSGQPKVLTTMTIKSLKLGGPIDEALFQAPKGIEFKDVAELEKLNKSAAARAAKGAKSKK